MSFLRACMRAIQGHSCAEESIFPLELVCAFEILPTVENSRIVVEKLMGMYVDVWVLPVFRFLSLVFTSCD